MPRGVPADEMGMMRLRKTIITKMKQLTLQWCNPKQRVYHRRPIDACILCGDTDCEGGLSIRTPVLGLTMGMAFLILVAAGWCNFRVVG